MTKLKQQKARVAVVVIVQKTVTVSPARGVAGSMRAVTVIPLAWAVQDEGLMGLTGAAVVTVATAPGVIGRVVGRVVDGAFDSTVRDLTVDAVTVVVTFGTRERVVVGTSSVVTVSARVCVSVAAASNWDGAAV